MIADNYDDWILELKSNYYSADMHDFITLSAGECISDAIRIIENSRLTSMKRKTKYRT